MFCYNPEKAKQNKQKKIIKKLTHKIMQNI